MIFAELEAENGHIFSCESCNVLLKATNAKHAYELAIQWAHKYEQNTTYKFLGVEELTQLGDQRPNHGDQLAGQFFDEDDVWKRRQELIPDYTKLAAIRWEGFNHDTPIQNLLSDEQLKQLKKSWNNSE